MTFVTLEKLQLNDASLQFEPNISGAPDLVSVVDSLDFSTMDVIQERLERSSTLTYHDSSVCYL